MPKLSSNMNFNLFLENDVVDYELINANFESIDKMVLCIESGEKTATYSGGATGNAIWRYKKYSDGTIELYTKIGFATLACNQGSKSPYHTSDCKAYIPISLTAIDNIQMHMVSDTLGWVNNSTGKDVLDCLTFKFISINSENDYVYKQVHISVKGKWK